MSPGTGSEMLQVGYLEVLTQKTAFTDREIQLFRTFTNPSKHERYEVRRRNYATDLQGFGSGFSCCNNPGTSPAVEVCETRT
jgi:hypothetical protein